MKKEVFPRNAWNVFSQKIYLITLKPNPNLIIDDYPC